MSTVDLLSREERNLYNPAFVALVVVRAVQGFEQENAGSCPIMLSILAPVMALTVQVRDALPATTNATTVNWIEREAAARIYLAQAAPHLGPIVMRGLSFGIRGQALELIEGSSLRSTGRIRKRIAGETEEVIAIQRASLFLGRWLSRAGDIATIMTLLGVRP